jgi:hypothetical protein
MAVDLESGFDNVRSMKTLLAILLSFLVTEAPVLAIHGGYTLGGSAGVVGTYAGVLIPTQDTLLTTGSSVSDFGANSLGLFTLSIPTSGLGSGQVFIFSGGEQLAGTIQAIPDPNSQTGILGVISATGEIAVAAVNNDILGIPINETQTQVTGQASGGFTATASASTISDSSDGINLDGTANVTVTSSTTSATTGGTSFVPTDQIVFAVDGFQQSAFATATTTAQ